MSLAVVVLNWNHAADTLRCVREVRSWLDLSPTVWVVDNASADDSIALIRKHCPDVHLIASDRNRGFAGGMNLGIAAALAAGNRPILLLNNDATIDQPDVQRLLATLEADEQLGAVAPLLFDSERRGCLLCAGGRNIGRHIDTHIYEIPAGDDPAEVDYVPGTVALVRAKLFETIGLFDEAYFFSGEMADLCERARRLGFPSAVDTGARAYHALSRSSELRDRLHAYYVLRNRFLFVNKFLGRERVVRYAFWSAWGVAATVKAYLQSRPATARALRLGLIDGLCGHFGGQNERVLATDRRDLTAAACDGRGT